MSWFVGVPLIILGCCYAASAWRDDREMGRVIKALEQRMRELR